MLSVISPHKQEPAYFKQRYKKIQALLKHESFQTSGKSAHNARIRWLECVNVFDIEISAIDTCRAQTAQLLNPHATPTSKQAFFLPLSSATRTTWVLRSYWFVRLTELRPSKSTRKIHAPLSCVSQGLSFQKEGLAFEHHTD